MTTPNELLGLAERMGRFVEKLDTIAERSAADKLSPSATTSSVALLTSLNAPTLRKAAAALRAIAEKEG